MCVCVCVCVFASRHTLLSPVVIFACDPMDGECIWEGGKGWMEREAGWRGGELQGTKEAEIVVVGGWGGGVHRYKQYVVKFNCDPTDAFVLTAAGREEKGKKVIQTTHKKTYTYICQYSRSYFTRQSNSKIRQHMGCE